MRNYNYIGTKCKCGKDITRNNLSGLCRSCGKLGHTINVGRKRSPEKREKDRLNHLGEKNAMWKGDQVGMNSLHMYVKKIFPKTILCECCEKVPPMDLANKGIYNRDPKNWESLCRKCHMTKDGRLKNLKQYATKK